MRLDLPERAALIDLCRAIQEFRDVLFANRGRNHYSNRDKIDSGINKIADSAGKLADTWDRNPKK